MNNKTMEQRTITLKEQQQAIAGSTTTVKQCPKVEVMVTDSLLIKAYREGDDNAFATLLNRYKNKVYSTIYLIVRNQLVAEDLTQETFIKVIKTLRNDQYQEQGKFAPWICRIAHNKAIDYTRRQKKMPTITMDNGQPLFERLDFHEDHFENKQISKEQAQLLRSLIDKLPENQREVLVLRHFADMSFKEIAEHTGVSINTALGRVRYALINLRKELKKNKRK